MIPQTEVSNQDGQKFISEDQSIELLVYRDYKNDHLTGGDLYKLKKAYIDELQFVTGVFRATLEGNAYTMEYKAEDVVYINYAQLSGDNYFNIRFACRRKDRQKLQRTINYVIQSLILEAVDADVIV